MSSSLPPPKAIIVMVIWSSWICRNALVWDEKEENIGLSIYQDLELLQRNDQNLFGKAATKEFKSERLEVKLFSLMELKHNRQRATLNS